MRFLQVGRMEPSLVNALERNTKCCNCLTIPRGGVHGRARQRQATAIVCFGPSGVDAESDDSTPQPGRHRAPWTRLRHHRRRRGLPTRHRCAHPRRAQRHRRRRCGRLDAGDDARLVRGAPPRSRREWPRNGSFTLGRDLSGSRVGILGLGGIGSAIAARLVGFDCVIAYHNRRPVPGSPYRYAASPVELAESIDVLVSATTGGAGTEKLVGGAVLEALGPDGYVINIARGSVVDQDALVELLVGGAGGGRPGRVRGGTLCTGGIARAGQRRADTPYRRCDCSGTPREGPGARVAESDQYVSHGTLTTPVVQPNGDHRHAIDLDFADAAGHPQMSGSDGVQRRPECHHGQDQAGRDGEQAEPGELGEADLDVVVGDDSSP